MSVFCLYNPPLQPVLSFAAQELLRHLALLDLPQGKQVPARFEVAELAPGDTRDCYRYRVTRQEAWFSGNSPRAVLLAVYAYLREIGFCFLRPGPAGTSLPAHCTEDSLYKEGGLFRAALRHRGVCIEGSESLENVLDFIDWLPKAGYNSFFLQFSQPDVFFERWYAHRLNPLLSPELPSEEALAQMDRRVSAELVKRGLLEHRVGHGWTAEALGYPANGWYQESLPPPASVRPLIALVNGKRVLWQGVPANTNLCYASSTVRRILTENVVRYARSHPNVAYLHIWLADEYNNICECSRCQATTPSDQYVALLNQMDEALTAAGLSVHLVFLLYQELLYAPLRARLQNKARFTLMFAPISRTFERPYPAVPRRVTPLPYCRNHITLPTSLEENLAHYEDWRCCFDGDSFVYDYPLGRAHYGDMGYMKIARVLYQDIRALPALGLAGYMSCQELRAALPTGFPNFVMGQALLDANADYESLRDRYFSAAFGKSGAQVWHYLEEISALCDIDYFNGKGPRICPQKAENYDKISTLTANFGSLTQQEGSDGRAEDWRALHYHTGYCRRLAAALAALCRGRQAEADRLFAVFCRYIREGEREFQPLLDVYRIIEVATKYTGFGMPEAESPSL